ncbi:hypothetical protein Droror1_Dr00005686 [Drosera rotundifolia]
MERPNPLLPPLQEEQAARNRRKKKKREWALALGPIRNKSGGEEAELIGGTLEDIGEKKGSVSWCGVVVSVYLATGFELALRLLKSELRPGGALSVNLDLEFFNFLGYYYRCCGYGWWIDRFRLVVFEVPVASEVVLRFGDGLNGDGVLGCGVVHFAACSGHSCLKLEKSVPLSCERFKLGVDKFDIPGVTVLCYGVNPSKNSPETNSTMEMILGLRSTIEGAWN